MSIEFKIITAEWNKHETVLREIRKTVFIDEQRVPAELEWDGSDSNCTHFLVSSDDHFIATARLKPDGQIGRMAVIKSCRRHGIGSELLDYILQHARSSGLSKVYCHAQIAVIDFYLKKGFEAYGKVFEEANIPHQAMSKKLCYK